MRVRDVMTYGAIGLPPPRGSCCHSPRRHAPLRHFHLLHSVTGVTSGRDQDASWAGLGRLSDTILTKSFWRETGHFKGLCVTRPENPKIATPKPGVVISS